MRRVLATEHGKGLYHQRQHLIESLFGGGPPPGPRRRRAGPEHRLQTYMTAPSKGETSLRNESGNRAVLVRDDLGPRRCVQQKRGAHIMKNIDSAEALAWSSP
jgi:hypothetical protein